MSLPVSPAAALDPLQHPVDVKQTPCGAETQNRKAHVTPMGHTPDDGLACFQTWAEPLW